MVRPHDRRHLLFHMNRQLNSFFISKGFKLSFNILKQIPQIHFSHYHIEFSGLDFRQIENIINQIHQLHTGFVNGFGKLHLFFR